MGTCESCLKPEHETTTHIGGPGGNQQYANNAAQSRSAHAVVTEESEEDDEIEDFSHEQLKKKKEKGHATISAEAYGKHNKKEDFKPKVIPKSKEQRERIIARLSKAFMFQALDDKERDIVINAMEEKRARAGEFVIQQGENGDVLYVVDEGQLDCTKRFKPNEDEKHLKVYQPGESFGELALLYNAPRAASIRAKTDCILWQLDRETFNAIVKDSAIKKRQSYEAFLKNISILESMDDYERSKIADCLKTIRFKAGEYIIKQGERGDTFFFIESGKAVATKRMSPGASEEEVFQYKEGQYFGELALLKDQPRAANVIAKTDITLAAIDRDGFKRVLGPLEEIMKRNTAKYKGYNF